MTDYGINDDDSILQKVQKLIDKAMSTEFPAERDALLAKADSMMIKYSIDQSALLDPSRPNTAQSVRMSQPEVRTIKYFFDSGTSRGDEEVQSMMCQLFAAVAHHCGARIGYFGWYESKVFGYPADLDFLEMMFLAVKLDIVRNLQPGVNPNMPWVESLASLKRAGLTWEQMHQKLQEHPAYPYRGQLWARNIGVGFTAKYRDWSLRHPEVVKTKTNPSVWRRSFIEGYEVEIRNRLYNMRQASICDDSNLPALLNNKLSSLEEAFYAQFPDKRPKAYTPAEIEAMRIANNKRKPVRYAAPKQRVHDRTAFGAGMHAASQADLSRDGSKVTNRKEALNG